MLHRSLGIVLLCAFLSACDARFTLAPNSTLLITPSPSADPRCRRDDVVSAFDACFTPDPFCYFFDPDNAHIDGIRGNPPYRTMQHRRMPFCEGRVFCRTGWMAPQSEPLGVLWLEPVSALSNLAYVVTGLMLLAKLQDELTVFRMVSWQIVALMSVGLGSLCYHGSGYLGPLDGLSMLALVDTTLWSLVRLLLHPVALHRESRSRGLGRVFVRWLSSWFGHLASVILMFSVLLFQCLMQLWSDAPVRFEWMFGAPVAASVVLLWLLARHDPTALRLFHHAFLSLSLAACGKLADEYLPCNSISLRVHGHYWWHVYSAAAMYHTILGCVHLQDSFVQAGRFEQVAPLLFKETAASGLPLLGVTWTRKQDRSQDVHLTAIVTDCVLIALLVVAQQSTRSDWLLVRLCAVLAHGAAQTRRCASACLRFLSCGTVGLLRVRCIQLTDSLSATGDLEPRGQHGGGSSELAQRTRIDQERSCVQRRMSPESIPQSRIHNPSHPQAIFCFHSALCVFRQPPLTHPLYFCFCFPSLLFSSRFPFFLPHSCFHFARMRQCHFDS